MLFSFSHSDPNLPKSWRVKANIWNLQLSDNLSCNLSGQMWNQPNIEFYHHDGLKNSNPDFITSEGFGGQFVSTINYDVNKNKNYIGYTLQLGYKSTGYAIGEQLNKGFIIRGGLSFKLSK
tara:strand:- start:164 stop:526 length:363 start_codon:yes stop_codon:yes gene_type:complete